MGHMSEMTKDYVKSLKPRDTSKETPQEAPSAKKDTTADLPMLDLAEALTFVTAIHEKALENSAMPDVAKGTGYAHASSTPFYRRTVASRLFGLLGSSRAQLTVRAKDYLKPKSDEARTKALRDAVMDIPLYAKEIDRFNGKKLNLQYVANAFGESLQISDTCASTCAKVFESSIKFAGFLSPDGTLELPSNSNGAKPAVAENPPAATPPASKGTDKTHSLPLNKAGTRSISVTAPLDITTKEIERVKKWLEVLVVEFDDNDGGVNELPT